MRTKIPCELSKEGVATFKKQRQGFIIGESRDKKCWWVCWDGNTSSYCYWKGFITRLLPTTSEQLYEIGFKNGAQEMKNRALKRINRDASLFSGHGVTNRILDALSTLKLPKPNKIELPPNHPIT